jgi:xanthine dehydrogenase accessory factor
MTAVLSSLAEVLGWRVSIADEASTAGVGPGSFVVVATQGHYDEPALEAALQSDAGYIGLVASAKRGSEVLSYLREGGAPEEQLSRIHCPAGLDLGHVEHEEIAVSILAELVARKATMAPAPVSEIKMPDQAIDPVCEMTVDVASAKWTSDIDGTTYYFCAPGCKKAFDRDPAAFA